jgi:hypothetical protein
MTVTAQASLESLAGELRNDAKAAGDKANHLSGWVDREMTDGPQSGRSWIHLFDSLMSA